MQTYTFQAQPHYSLNYPNITHVQEVHHEQLVRTYDHCATPASPSARPEIFSSF
jgi:hypothetical protein